jgi:hypothetical protein
VIVDEYVRLVGRWFIAARDQLPVDRVTEVFMKHRVVLEPGVARNTTVDAVPGERAVARDLDAALSE